MFTQRCFIRKNTPELAEKLAKICCLPRTPKFSSVFNILYASEKFLTCAPDSAANRLIADGFIDCKTNDELFLAIAAMNSDSDYMQYFTNGQDFILCEKQDWIDEISSLCVGGNYNYDKNGELSYGFRKATVKDLFDYFKTTNKFKC